MKKRRNFDPSRHEWNNHRSAEGYFKVQTGCYVLEHDGVGEAVLVLELALVDAVVDDMRVDGGVFNFHSSATAAVYGDVVLVNTGKGIRGGVQVVAVAMQQLRDV